MKILIPPSEGKTTIEDGALFSITSYTHLHQIKEIITRITHYDGDYTKLFDVKAERVQEVLAHHQSILQQHTTQAIKRYRGVVYKHLDYTTLTNKKYANTHLRIVSGMFGLITPTTLIPNYRLKMSKLQVTDLWKPLIIKELAKEDIIIDCLTELHRKAYDHSHIIRVDFFKGNKNAGHHAKAVKGKFIRWLVENKVEDQKQFVGFTEEGYHWNGTIFVCK